jgi:hypothetical protein
MYIYIYRQFLGLLAKLRKATISFVMSLCRSSAITAITGRIFMKFDVLGIFRKSLEIIQVSLKSDKNKGYFTSRRMYINDNISLNFS